MQKVHTEKEWEDVLLRTKDCCLAELIEKARRSQRPDPDHAGARADFLSGKSIYLADETSYARFFRYEDVIVLDWGRPRRQIVQRMPAFIELLESTIVLPTLVLSASVSDMPTPELMQFNLHAGHPRYRKTVPYSGTFSVWRFNKTKPEFGTMPSAVSEPITPVFDSYSQTPIRRF